MPEKEDKELIKKYQEGDEKSLEVLIKNHFRSLYSFLFHFVGNQEDAEDLTQEVCVKIWKNTKHFDLDKNFQSWMFRTAKNAALDFLKKKKALPFSWFEREDGTNEIEETIMAQDPLPDEILAQKDQAKIIHQALAKLPARQRVVLFLYYASQYNLREISEIFDESLDTVKSRHYRALQALKEELKNRMK